MLFIQVNDNIDEVTPSSNGIFFRIKYLFLSFDIMDSVIMSCQCGFKFVKTLVVWIVKDLAFASDHVSLDRKSICL